MKKMSIEELKKRSAKAMLMLKDGKQLPEHDFNSVPKWDMLIHKVIAEMLGFRLRSKITQDELAQRMNIKQSVISRYEHVGRNPSIEFLYKVANGLGLQLFVTPFGDRTVVLTPEQKEILEKYTSEEKPDFRAVLSHVIYEFDGRYSCDMVIPNPDNEEEIWAIEIKTTKQPEENPYRIAALSYS